jgi:CubicO group peptidase (beta-lactamase class C family)
VVEWLLEAGADVFCENKNGQRPSQLAFGSGYPDIASLLHPLHLAARRGNTQRMEELLVLRPDLLNARDEEGRTALHKAFRYNRPEAVRFLASRGADDSLPDNYGYTPGRYSQKEMETRTGMVLVGDDLEDGIDFISLKTLDRYDYLKICLVQAGRIVFSRVYGRDRLDNDDVWGSVSKPVTAMLIMHLVRRGVIRDIDDPVWRYSSRYAGSMPREYADAILTLRHLLTHTGGVPHNNEPTWKNGKLNLKFKPGERDMYSTPGYGILGHVIEDATGMSYGEAVQHFIGKAAGAPSFWAEKHFRAPGARVHSTVEDMARFSLAVMNSVYVSEDVFFGQMIQPQGRPSGMGWGILHPDSSDWTAFHGGSNGRPQAYLMIKPRKKLSVSILALSKTRSFALTGYATALMSLLEEFPPEDFD